MNTPATDWNARHHEAVRSLISQGSEALRQDNIDLANAALSEAAIILDMDSADSLDGDRLRAQAYNELGVVHQRRGDANTALAFHEQAAQLTLKVIEEDGEFRNNAIATHLNLASICAALEQYERGDEAASFAMAHAEAAREDEGIDNIIGMLVGSYQITATLDAHQGRFEEADANGDRAVALAREFYESHEEAEERRIFAQTAQGCQQLSVILFHADEHERAFRWGRVAEELAAEAYEDLGQEILPIYVISQINLISYSEKLGQFADAEDSLWKAIEIIGNDPRLLKRGKDFYEFCKKQSDKRLEAGNLPRDEVNQSYKEILERIEEIGGLPQELLDEDED